MARQHKKALAAVNTEGWMMSYADMATILLAMFIVLSTLGKDQTGGSLQKGLESYRESRQYFGLSGVFPSSRAPNKLGHVQPRYTLQGDGNPDDEGKKPSAPDGFSADREKERFQHFVNELSRQFNVERLPQVVAQATVDFFEPLGKTEPYWTALHQEALAPVLPLLRRGDYRVVLIVWAPMAKEGTLARAAEKARQLADELAATAQLDASARGPLLPVAQTWPYANFQRPVVSLVIAKTAPAVRGP
jgi:hypothetical protein